MTGLDLVVKIGSMALIQKAENEIDYNIFQRLGGDLRPGMVLYEHYETAYITPDEAAIEKLLVKA